MAGCPQPGNVQEEARQDDAELDDNGSHSAGNAESRDAEGGNDGERGNAAQDRPPCPDPPPAIWAKNDCQKENPVGTRVGSGDLSP